MPNPCRSKTSEIFNAVPISSSLGWKPWWFLGCSWTLRPVSSHQRVQIIETQSWIGQQAIDLKRMNHMKTFMLIRVFKVLTGTLSTRTNTITISTHTYKTKRLLYELNQSYAVFFCLKPCTYIERFSFVIPVIFFHHHRRAVFTLNQQECFTVLRCEAARQYLYPLPFGALCFVWAPHDATGAMTTLQVWCHLVIPQSFLYRYINVPYKELLGLNYAVKSPLLSPHCCWRKESGERVGH